MDSDILVYFIVVVGWFWINNFVIFVGRNFDFFWGNMRVINFRII